ncbi:MAG: hypothetical protein AAB344_04615, partial [Bacteroidota bacterium]
LRPETTDKQLLKVGRIMSLVIGLVVTGLALVFVHSQFGIFNLLVTFFTLFNIPVTVPTAFGLIFRRVPKWSASAAIAWGLIAGATTRFILGWDIGPQVYLSFALTFGVFVTSYWTGKLYKSNRWLIAAMSLLLASGLSWLFTHSAVGKLSDIQYAFAIVAGVTLGLSLFGFSKLFASETDEQREVIKEFFKKLDTPIDVAKEVFGQGKKQVSTFPLVGGTTIGMGILMSLIFLKDVSPEETIVLGAIIVLLIVVGSLMWFFGKKSEIRTATQYEDRTS